MMAEGSIPRPRILQGIHALSYSIASTPYHTGLFRVIRWIRIIRGSKHYLHTAAWVNTLMRRINIDGN